MEYVDHTGTSFRFLFNTRNSSSAPTSLLGSPVIAIYEEGSTTQITAGITLTVDYDSVTGLNEVLVDTTSLTSGKKYTPTIQVGTVSGTSIAGTTLREGIFRIGQIPANVHAIIDTHLSESNAGNLAGSFISLLDKAAGSRNLSVESFSQTGDIFPKFAGISLLAQWLGLLAGKQAGNGTARTELRNTGAGSGTFDETTDSLEAIRENATAPLDAAGTAAAVWNAATATYGSAGSYGLLVETNLDGQVSTRASQTSVDDVPTAAENAAGLLDLVDSIDTGLTLRKLLRGVSASLVGKLSGGGSTTITFRNYADTKNVLVATVDGDGNRSAITYDLT
jgi:hypothetical protein